MNMIRRFNSSLIKTHYYPSNNKTFIRWLAENPKRQHMHNNLDVKLFDVTLRDGLQGLTRNEIKKYDLKYKKELFYKVLHKNNPQYFEVGSLVNSKLYPVFENTEIFYKDLVRNNPQLNNLYLLIPNKKYLYNAINMNVSNFSFITSASNSFQKKNMNMTVEESKLNIYEMLDDINYFCKYIENEIECKVYISCINHCPIEGTIENDAIVQEIMSYIKNRQVTDITLSDTCGTLQSNDFNYLLNNILMITSTLEKISLHLHTTPEYNDNTENIIHTALDHGITRFDVSYLDSGGCSMTIDKSKIRSNLTYNQFYYYYCRYIDEKMMK